MEEGHKILEQKKTLMSILKRYLFIFNSKLWIIKFKKIQMHLLDISFYKVLDKFSQINFFL